MEATWRPFACICFIMAVLTGAILSKSDFIIIGLEGQAEVTQVIATFQYIILGLLYFLLFLQLLPEPGKGEKSEY